MFRIGLTGGIAAGKSTAAARLSELGAVVIDHDVLAREAVAVGSRGLEQIVETFGERVLSADGSLNRPLLGQIVFGDSDALAKLNAIVHPEVYRLSDEAERAASLSGARVVVHDIPLLVETGQQHDFDLLVVVDAPDEARVARLIEKRGMMEAEAEARVASHISDEKRRAHADVILDAATTVENLRRQVDEVWGRIGS